MWHLQRAFFLMIVVTLSLLFTYMTLMRATSMTQWKATFVGEQETLVPALSWLPTSNTGQLKYWREKEDPAVEELLQILQSRIQNFTVLKFYWKEKKCYENMTGASPCYDTTCPRQFPSSLRDRLQQMLSARATIPARYLQALASAAQPVTSHKYIFVTGASSNHYKEMQGLLYNLFYTLFPRMKGQDFALVVYNLGLTPREKELTEKHCRCTLIDFPFDGLPAFVQQLKCATWKPMIVASLLEKAEYVVWMDTSIRWFNSTPLFHLFRQARASSYLTRRNGKSIGVHTQASTARFFGDHLCQYTPFPQTSSGLGFYYNDSNCMCVKNHTQLLKCWSSTHQLVTCHRFDQSVISMIIAKLYMENLPVQFAPRSAIRIRRGGDSMNWFNSA